MQTLSKTFLGFENFRKNLVESFLENFGEKIIEILSLHKENVNEETIWNFEAFMYAKKKPDVKKSSFWP